MSDVKIIPDTNIIVAASIMENIHELDIVVKHPFYDQSIQLFSLFYPPKLIDGYALPQVKAECYGVLSRAVKGVYVPKKFTNSVVKERFYNDAVGIISSSEHKMRRLLSKLKRVRLDNSQVQKNLRDVEDMSHGLRQLYNQKYKKKYERKKESKIRAKPILNEPKWNKEQKDEVVQTHGGQIVREAKQLERFMRKTNEPDERVLAQAITFKNSLGESDSPILLASSDTSFFSPYHYYGGKSDTVTEEIYKRFGIICDHPRDIFKMAGGML